MNNSKYSAVVFDLDGTILYTLEDIKNSLNHGLRAHNREELNLQEVRSRVGHGLKKLVEDALPAADRNSHLSEEIYLELARHYRKDPVGESLPYPGITACLQTLNEHTVPMALLSNKDEDLVEVISSRLFPGFFALSCGKALPPAGGGQPSRKPKPDPAGLIHIANTMDIAVEDILYVGDSEVDFQTAANAGCHFCAVSWGYRDRVLLEKLGSEIIIDSSEELTALLLGGR